MDIVEANNKQDYNYSKGYTFPGTSKKTSFTFETIPALKSWSGKNLGYAVTDITEKDGLISFEVRKDGNAEDTGVGASIYAEDGEPVFYNLQGLKIDKPSKGEIVLMKKGNKITKIIK